MAGAAASGSLSEVHSGQTQLAGWEHKLLPLPFFREPPPAPSSSSSSEKELEPLLLPSPPPMQDEQTMLGPWRHCAVSLFFFFFLFFFLFFFFFLSFFLSFFLPLPASALPDDGAQLRHRPPGPWLHSHLDITYQRDAMMAGGGTKPTTAHAHTHTHTHTPEVGAGVGRVHAVRAGHRVRVIASLQTRLVCRSRTAHACAEVGYTINMVIGDRPRSS